MREKEIDDAAREYDEQLARESAASAEAARKLQAHQRQMDLLNKQLGTSDTQCKNYEAFVSEQESKLNNLVEQLRDIDDMTASMERKIADLEEQTG